MATETERKFLVKGKFKHESIKQIEIVQYYLVKSHDKTIRLRISEGRAFLTIKSKIKEKTITSYEWEYQIPIADSEEIKKSCLPGKVVKTRYLVPSGRHYFEVDVFHDKNEGIVIAEIELNSEDEKFESPIWLGEEVTGRPEYYSANLCK